MQQGVYDEHGEDVNTTQQKVPNDVSKHTFYVLNSQMRLKISAKTEVIALSNVHEIFLTEISSYF